MRHSGQRRRIWVVGPAAVLFGLATGACGRPVTRQLTETPASAADAGGWVAMATTLAVLLGAATAAVAVRLRWDGRGDAEGVSSPMAAAACTGAAATAFGILACLLFGVYHLMLAAADPSTPPPRSLVEITHVSSSDDDPAVAARNDANLLLLLAATPAVGALTSVLATVTIAYRRPSELRGPSLALIATFGTLLLSLPLVTLASSLRTLSNQAVGVRVVPFQSLPAMLAVIAGLSLVSSVVLEQAAE